MLLHTRSLEALDHCPGLVSRVISGGPRVGSSWPHASAILVKNSGRCSTSPTLWSTKPFLLRHTAPEAPWHFSETLCKTSSLHPRALDPLRALFGASDPRASESAVASFQFPFLLVTHQGR